jgi:fucose permease
MSPIEAGLAYLPATVIIFFVSGATSTLGEKVSPRVMIAGGLGLVAAGMALMTLAGAESSWTATLPGLLVAGVGTGLFNPALTAVALGSAPVEQSGLAAGTNDTFRQAGIAIGVAALGALVPAGAAFDPTRHVEYVDGLHAALWTGAGVAALGALAAGMLIRSAARAPRMTAELAPEAA